MYDRTPDEEVSHSNDSLQQLEYLEEVRDWSSSVKAQFQTLKIELKFLRLFFICIGMQYHNATYYVYELYEIEDVKQDLENFIRSRFVEAEDGKVSMNLDGWLTYAVESIGRIRPEVNQCYHRIAKIALYNDPRSWSELYKLYDCVLENLQDLRSPFSQVTSIFEVKKLIDALERRLLFLRKSLKFIHQLTCHELDVRKEVTYVIIKAASFFFSCRSSKVDDENKELPDLSLALNYRPDSETTIYHKVLDPFTLKRNSEEKLVVGYIDLLLHHLGEVLSSNGSPEIISKDQLESLREELKLLKFLHTGTPLQEAGHVISYQQRMGVHVNKAARLIEDLYVGNINEINDDILPQVLGRLKLINIFCGLELGNHKATLVAPAKDQSETLDEDMRLLRAFYIDTQKVTNVDKEFMDIHSNMDAMALEAAPVFYSLYFNETKEDMAEEMMLLLPDLLEKINLIKEDMRIIHRRQARSSDFPKIGGQRGTTTSLKQFHKLLIEREDTVSLFVKPHMRKCSKLQIEHVKNKLEILISFVVKFEEEYIEIGENLEKRITNMANEAKRVTNPSFIKENTGWIWILNISELREEVKLINKDLERIDKEISGEMLSSQENALGEVIVGFDDAGEEIIEQLVEGQQQLKVISIIGMGGLGKTTLAKKLYNDPSVVRYFDVRAWCSVSQEYRSEQMLIDILGQVSEGSNVKSVVGLEERLYKCLKGRRYLIVMDDIWDIQAWTALSRCFADDGNGSRVVFTTRIAKIVLKVQRGNSIPYNLRYFNEDESLELLQKKLFSGKRCPTDQLETVKQIAKNCKGLPLAVVLMAGVLARKTREDWKEVAESLSPHTDQDLQTLSMKVLELSYTNLPGYLRECFLYFAGFPEDREIAVKKLMWLWVSEGLIQKSEHKSLEDLAKDYLMDLIGRSLVTVAEIGSSGGVKTCRIHDLLLDLSLRKAKEEKFLLLLDGKGEPSAVHQKVESSTSNPITDKRYRLCIHSMPHDFDKWSPDEDVCSLQCHLNMKFSYDASFVFSIFKFLNVLDLERLLLKDLNCGIELLVQLRLLAVRIQSNIIPESISKLSNLETFIVQGIRGEIDIPDKVWSMVSLRHLHVDKRASLLWGKSDGKHSALDKLETLSTPSLPCGDSSRDVISLLLNLHKLKCIFIDVDSDNNFPGLRSLIQLESLKVLYYGRKVLHGTFSFPQNLKKLTLSKFQLPWSDIATIGNLPNLEVLKLLFKAFDGKEWETRDDEFPKLKYLKLESLDIEQWNVASEDHFPRLEKLVVHRCKQLEEIPFCFADMNTLQTIEVKWCNLSASNSAQEIYKNRLEEMDDERFKVVIHPNPSDHGLASSS